LPIPVSCCCLAAGLRGFIAPSTEPRFVCHRYSNLYDAMFYSEFVATRLGTFRYEAGDKVRWGEGGGRSSWCGGPL